MTHKPEIQYIGQFYVHGSEARALELQEKKKQPKTRLPIAKLEKIEKVYVDPVALVAIAVAVFMLVTMLLGVARLYDDWQEYQVVSERVETLRLRNHEKVEAYRATYDLKDIQVKAAAMGMIPKAETQHMTVKISVPQPEPPMTFLEEVKWFVTGLFA